MGGLLISLVATLAALKGHLSCLPIVKADGSVAQ